MQVVVTGGAGFIGANLTRELLSRSEISSVVVADDFSTGHRSNIVPDDRLEVAEGTLLDLDWLAQTCSDAGAIVHLGAVPSVPRSLADPLQSHHANATGTLHVLEVARDTGAHVIVASSSSVYGANPTLPKREDLVPRPRSPYAASKLATEAYALAYGDSFGLDVLAFRFFNVYGPLQSPDHAYTAVVPVFISAALAQHPLTIHGDGKQPRDFTYVGTVTNVLCDAVARRVTAESPVNLAFGSRTSILDLAATIGDLVDVKLDLEHVDPRPGDVRDSQADNSRLRALFPDAEATPLDEGLRETIRWFRS